MERLKAWLRGTSISFAPEFMKPMATTLLAGAAFAIAPGSAEAASAPLQASCQLHSPGNRIKRVVYIIFDNVHLRRDNPNVPSDLEQMPNLLNFLQGNGVVSGNHFTPLISHTADDILTGLDGGLWRSPRPARSRTASGSTRPTTPPSFSRPSFVYWTTTTAQSHPEAGENLPRPFVEREWKERAGAVGRL